MTWNMNTLIPYIKLSCFSNITYLNIKNHLYHTYGDIDEISFFSVKMIDTYEQEQTLDVII